MSDARAGADTMSRLKVLDKTGWEFIEYQMHGVEKKFKPGWVSTTPGSVLRMQVDTSFAGVDATTNSSLIVLFLTSYEHMGQAELRCTKNCACEGGKMDGHRGTEQRISVAHPQTFPVTQHDQCVLELSVLPETNSGEHKFKMIMLSVLITTTSSLE